MTERISCATHDYFEAACTLNYRLATTLHEGSRHQGIALDLVYNEQKEECLVLLENAQHITLRIAEMSKIQVLTQKALFTVINIYCQNERKNAQNSANM